MGFSTIAVTQHSLVIPFRCDLSPITNSTSTNSNSSRLTTVPWLWRGSPMDLLQHPPLSLWQFPLLDMLIVISILISILHSCSNLKSTALSITFHIACFDIISIIYDDFLNIVWAIPNLIFFHRDLVFPQCASLVAHFPTSHRPHENVNHLTFFGTTKRWHSRSQFLLCFAEHDSNFSIHVTNA